jgi:hypothetical protein
MTKMTDLTASLAVKLASLAVHVDEIDLANPTAAAVDISAAKALAGDAEVAAWLAAIDPVLLPVKR